MKKKDFLTVFALILALFVGCSTFVKGSGETNLEIADFYPCVVIGNPQYHFPIKTTAYFNVTIKSLEIDPKDATIFLSAKDEIE